MHLENLGLYVVCALHGLSVVTDVRDRRRESHLGVSADALWGLAFALTRSEIVEEEGLNLVHGTRVVRIAASLPR